MTPIPELEQLELLARVESRGVNPAACRSRQKSLRGFAKCAAASADTRPGLMPQKTTVETGPEHVRDRARRGRECWRSSVTHVRAFRH